MIEGENREVSAARLAEETASRHGYTLIHPFETFDVMAGQGTVGVEMAQDTKVDHLERKPNERLKIRLSRDPFHL